MKIPVFEQIGKAKKARKISDMEVGENGYAVPWAATFDEDGNVISLNDDFTVTDSNAIGETASMFVSRTLFGYTVDLRGCEGYEYDHDLP